MFDCAVELILDFIPIIPPLICIILLFNIIADLLWGGK